MLKSDLEIEPYTIKEALLCINKELKSIKRRPIGKGHLWNLVSNIVKPERIKIKGKPHLLPYNSIVDIFNYVTIKRYPVNRKSRLVK